MNSRAAWLAAIVGGTALWTIASLVEARPEPWDSSSYWAIYLPVAFLYCGVLGWLFPDRPWRWALGVVLAQFPVMLAFTGEVGSMFVAGIFVLLVEVLPAIFAGHVGAWFGKGLAPGSGA